MGGGRETNSEEEGFTSILQGSHACGVYCVKMEEVFFCPPPGVRVRANSKGSFVGSQDTTFYTGAAGDFDSTGTLQSIRGVKVGGSRGSTCHSRIRSRFGGLNRCVCARTHAHTHTWVVHTAAKTLVARGL